MILHNLLMTILTIVFPISMGLNSSQNINYKLCERLSGYFNQSFALFMPVEKKIVTDVTTSNDESC